MKRESFTQNVKNEVCSLEYTSNQLMGLLAGFIKTNGKVNFNDNTIKLTTENANIAKLIYKSISLLFNVSPTFSYTKKMKLDKCVVYTVNINQNIHEILEKLELYEGKSPIFPYDIITNDGLRTYIAGVFLASGSLNPPNSDNYHLQMNVGSESEARYLVKLLNKFKNEKNMDFKILPRRNKYMVYLKKADQIANFLALINALVSLLDFENVRIEKDFINSDNRYQICFNANYKRTLDKANEQIEDIKLIEQKIGLNTLNEKEQIIAKIRLENNDIPLSSISNLLKEEYNLNVSKSGVSRVFNNLHDLANRIRGDK
jgi:hypothetical protein